MTDDRPRVGHLVPSMVSTRVDLSAMATPRANGLCEVPSGRLRFVQRGKNRVLQQEWRYGGTATQVAFWDAEWRDVPLSDE